jgi:hypothetical protein
MVHVISLYFFNDDDTTLYGKVPASQGFSMTGRPRWKAGLLAT